MLQFVAHLFLLFGVNMVGVFYNYLADLAQRKTFSQTRRYLISLTTIEEQKIKKVNNIVSDLLDIPSSYGRTGS